MKKIKIIKNGIVTNINNDSSQSDSQKNAWLQQEIANGSFGKPERWVTEGTEDISGALETREIVNLDGSLIIEYRLPADYEIVEEDMSQDIIDKKMADVRKKRDELLAECDYTQLADAPFSSEEKQIWRTYRQALRDVPNNIFDPLEHEPVWPEKPSL